MNDSSVFHMLCVDEIGIVRGDEGMSVCVYDQEVVLHAISSLSRGTGGDADAIHEMIRVEEYLESEENWKSLNTVLTSRHLYLSNHNSDSQRRHTTPPSEGRTPESLA